MEITLQFHGPLAMIAQAECEDLWNHFLRDTAGIYLWTIPFEADYLVNYVGETGSSFSTRTWDQIKDMRALSYRPVDIELFKQGFRKWPDDLTKAEHLANVEQNLKLYRLFIAPTKVDKAARKCAEYGITSHLAKTPGKVGSFLFTRRSYRPEHGPLKILFGKNSIIGLPAVLEC